MAFWGYKLFTGKILQQLHKYYIKAGFHLKL